MYWNYKGSTEISGTDAEHYVALLLGMINQSKDERLPDLISRRYSRPITIEVKSGKDKANLVDYQLHYAITSKQDYKEYFGKEFKGQPMDFFNQKFLFNDDKLGNESIAFYYNLVNRVDDVGFDQLVGPGPSIRCEWGDQYIVPAKFAFYQFAVNRAYRTGEDLGEVVEDLHKIMQHDVLYPRGQLYETRKGEKKSWQNMHANDILAVWHNDDRKTTVRGRERIQGMKIFYQLDELVRVKFDGPNGTNIYVLAEQNDESLFDQEIRPYIGRQKEVAENMIAQRADKAVVLDKAIIDLGFPDKRSEIMNKVADLLRDKKEFLSCMEQHQIQTTKRMMIHFDYLERLRNTRLKGVRKTRFEEDGRILAQTIKEMKNSGMNQRGGAPFYINTAKMYKEELEYFYDEFFAAFHSRLCQNNGLEEIDVLARWGMSE